ncbi:MAG: putative colanic acid biosynthesis acetyltransferase [Verrucomicrobia bacterium]|nr:putative colanic acid biosynthesis acetyltransferase [Verrucomicrobiota bacterium]
MNPLHTHTQDDFGTSPWTLGQRVKMALWFTCWALLCAWTPKQLNFVRLAVLRAFGARLHGRPFVHPKARIRIPWHLTMQHRACLGEYANAYTLGEIEIGEGSTVAQEAYLCTGTHDLDDPKWPLQTAKITIGRDVFIGARAFVLPGVVIGDRAVIGACSVVTKDIPANAVAAGQPAKVLRLRASAP